MKQKLLTNVQINNYDYISYYNLYTTTKLSTYKLFLLYYNEFFFSSSLIQKRKIFKHFFGYNFNLCNIDTFKLELSNIIIKDLINLNVIWRLIKGYGTKGQRTHSNNKFVKKNKLLHKYRLDQFFFKFGFRKRNIYPTLIIAEYTNKLWYFNWLDEWNQASKFLVKLCKPNTRKIPFDPVKLSKNFTNGYVRVGKAAKIGKSKKITKVVTIGVPIFFSRWLCSCYSLY